MRTLTLKDWQPFRTAIAVEINEKVQNGTLTPPLLVVITDSDDEVLFEMKIEYDASGNGKVTPIPQEASVTEISYPVIYTVTDHKCHEVETVISEEVVRNLRKVS
jgi:hypothetical protein